MSAVTLTYQGGFRGYKHFTDGFSGSPGPFCVVFATVMRQDRKFWLHLRSATTMVLFINMNTGAQAKLEHGQLRQIDGRALHIHSPEGLITRFYNGIYKNSRAEYVRACAERAFAYRRDDRSH